MDLKSIFEAHRNEVSLFAPLIIVGAILIVIVSSIFLPASKKLAKLGSDITAKKNLLLSVEKTARDIEKIKSELAALKEKSSAYEKQLPSEIRASLLIETLKDITEQAQLQFVSIEPQTIKKINLSGSGALFLDLPIKIKLKCGFYELIRFLTQIEKSDRLMKITDLSIKSSSRDFWEHDIEVMISTYASGVVSDAK